MASAIAAGAHIMTIPSKILAQMPFNKRSEETMKEFDEAWEQFLAMRKAGAAPITAQAK
ncbi:MAG: hypothetical protein PXY39_02880 [archaeon]|nr:hypothetical protein [archaeon]